MDRLIDDGTSSSLTPELRRRDVRTLVLAVALVAVALVVVEIVVVVGAASAGSLIAGDSDEAAARSQ